jgi:hypothetical protein
MPETLVAEPLQVQLLLVVEVVEVAPLSVPGRLGEQ